MSILRFSDGIEVDTSGEYRTLKLHDGWYAVGHGRLSPCANEEEALRLCGEWQRELPDRSGQRDAGSSGESAGE